MCMPNYKAQAQRQNIQKTCDSWKETERDLNPDRFELSLLLPVEERKKESEEKQPLYIHVRLLFINRRHVTTTQSASRAEYLRVFGIGFHEREERKRKDKKRNSLFSHLFFGSCQTIIRDAYTHTHQQQQLLYGPVLNYESKHHPTRFFSPSFSNSSLSQRFTFHV